MMNRIKIAPSILSADFSQLGNEIILAEKGGADLIHVDVMDGHFVPNITIGPVVISAIRDKTKLPFDVHLMIENPLKYVDAFAKAGADIITFHAETNHLLDTIKKIKNNDKKVGISLNPSTPLSVVNAVIDKIDLLLIMTVNPGFSGQKFILDVLPKIEKGRKIIDEGQLEIDLEVDGGINEKTAPLAVKHGANILVAGSSVFGGDVVERIASLRRCIEGAKHKVFKE